ncbi:MAG: DUF2752 domain-containing protein [Acidobacteria bacterium]|nr:MAG: DUF2752 domain-containing protein [Acidobacteriota bacterium]
MRRPPHPPRRSFAFLWGGSAVLLVAAAAAAPSLATLVPACPLKTLTGIPCPGCGSTRALLALARFAPLEAFAHYPLAAAGWTLFVAGGVVAAAAAAAGRPLAGPRRMPAWLKVLLAALLAANWIWNLTQGV